LIILIYNLNFVLFYLARCWEDRCYIAPEKVYFEQRQSIPHYKLYLESIALEALKTPCKFFLTQNIDEATLQKYQMELQAARDSAKAMRIYLTKLQKAFGHKKALSTILERLILY